jgi:hypothetical protein
MYQVAPAGVFAMPRPEVSKYIPIPEIPRISLSEWAQTWLAEPLLLNTLPQFSKERVECLLARYPVVIELSRKHTPQRVAAELRRIELYLRDGMNGAEHLWPLIHPSYGMDSETWDRLTPVMLNRTVPLVVKQQAVAMRRQELATMVRVKPRHAAQVLTTAYALLLVWHTAAKDLTNAQLQWEFMFRLLELCEQLATGGEEIPYLRHLRENRGHLKAALGRLPELTRQPLFSAS